MKIRNYQLLSQLRPADYWLFLDRWPPEYPLLALGGNGSDIFYLPLAFSKISPNQCFDLHFSNSEKCESHKVFPEFVGLIPYELYARHNVRKSEAVVFAVSKTLVFDVKYDAVYLATQEGLKPDFDFNWEDIFQLPGEADEADQIIWQPSQTNEQYLNLVQACLEDIKNGRYYQINLLRYFRTIAKKIPWSSRFKKHAGPFAAWLRWDDRELVSFSPERFFKIFNDDTLKVITDPIKGTVPVSRDPQENQRLMDQLHNSEKDHAELHMIVDLMRNDLHRICLPQTVLVKDPGSLHSFSNVHHLIARIEGQLKSGLTLQEVLWHMCPGGSITGAPKIEVMKAITEKEQRLRAMFMGNCFIFDRQNSYFDASILIRTVMIEQGVAEFAAGSGIVIHSQAQFEMEEIWAKGQVVGLGGSSINN